jgi:hypothetical protein
VDQAEVFGELDDMTEARATPEEFLDWAENTGTEIASVVAEGGGMLIVDSHVNMTRCEVRGNIAWAMLGMVSGGGIQIHRSVVNIVASVFTENKVSVYNTVLTYDTVRRSQGDLVTSALALDFPGVFETLLRNMYLLMTQISESTGAAISVGSERDYYVDVNGNSKDQLFLKVRKRVNPNSTERSIAKRCNSEGLVISTYSSPFRTLAKTRSAATCPWSAASSVATR